MERTALLPLWLAVGCYLQRLRKRHEILFIHSHGALAHQGELWSFPTSTSVPKPVQKAGPPMWIAARDPDSHNFAVKNGCNVMVTPVMKGDEEGLRR